MSTVLHFKPAARVGRGDTNPGGTSCEIVIFPGVRMEREAVDLSYRICDAAGQGDFEGLSTTRYPIRP